MYNKVRDATTWTTITVRPNCPAATALALLLDAETDHLFVVDDDQRFRGVITDGNLLKAELTGTLTQTMAADWMHCRPECLDPDQPLVEAAKLFRDNSLSRAPVLREGRLLGVLRRRDVLRWIVSQHSERTVAAPRFLTRLDAAACQPALNEEA